MRSKPTLKATSSSPCVGGIPFSLSLLLGTRDTPPRRADAHAAGRKPTPESRRSESYAGETLQSETARPVAPPVVTFEPTKVGHIVGRLSPSSRDRKSTRLNSSHL